MQLENNSAAPKMHHTGLVDQTLEYQCALHHYSFWLERAQKADMEVVCRVWWGRKDWANSEENKPHTGEKDGVVRLADKLVISVVINQVMFTVHSKTRFSIFAHEFVTDLYLKLL